MTLEEYLSQSGQAKAYAPGSLQVVAGPDGMYSAINPRTGQREPVYNDNDTSYMYFASDGNVPASAAPAGTPSYHTDNSSTFDNFMERAVLGGLGAIGGAGALGLDAAPALGATAPAAVGGTGAGTTSAAAGAGGEAVAASPSLFPLNLTAPEIAIPELGATDLGAIGAAAGVGGGVGGLTGALATGAGTAGAAQVLGGGQTGQLPSVDVTPQPKIPTVDLTTPQTGGVPGEGTTYPGESSNAGSTTYNGGTSGPWNVIDGATNAATSGLGSKTVGDLLGGNVGLGDLASGISLGDLAKFGGNALPGVLGYLGASQQTNAYKDLANQWMGFGAPYRQQLGNLYTQSGVNDYLSSPAVTAPVQQGTDAVARALSINGNPAGSGSALQEIQNYATNAYANWLGQEKDRLAGFGGLSQYNQAAPAAANSGILSQGNEYNAIGYGLGRALNPQPTININGLLMRGLA